jgi:hypothetical protein
VALALEEEKNVVFLGEKEGMGVGVVLEEGEDVEVD